MSVCRGSRFGYKNDHLKYFQTCDVEDWIIYLFTTSYLYVMVDLEECKSCLK